MTPQVILTISNDCRTSARVAAQSVYEPGYDDPDADLILQSNDAKKFRVRSYHLRSASAFFRDMPCPLEAPPGVYEVPVIDMAGNKHTIRRLLDVLTLPNPSPITLWAHVEDLLELGRRYQFERLPRLVALQIVPCLRRDAWKVFVFASQHDIYLLAKTAAVKLHTDTTSPFDHKTTADKLQGHWLANVPSAYCIGLAQAIAKNTVGTGRNVQVNWEGVGASFEIS